MPFRVMVIPIDGLALVNNQCLRFDNGYIQQWAKAKLWHNVRPCPCAQLHHGEQQEPQEVYSGPSQTSNMGFFVKKVNC